MKIISKIQAMKAIEERLEIVISRFDTALWLEDVFVNDRDKFKEFFDTVKFQKKIAQRELRNLRKRLATAKRKVLNEKENE